MVKPQRKVSICRMQILTVNLGICLIISVMLSLALAFADNSAKAAKPSSNLNLITPADKETLELYPPYGSHIRIDPPAPMPNDIIRITASGDWPNVCVPRYYSHQIMGNVIRIEAVATLFGVCIPVELPKSWSFDVEVGPLPVALYTIKLYIRDPLVGPIPYDTASFLVSTERLYLPIIYHTHYEPPIDLGLAANH